MENYPSNNNNNMQEFLSPMPLKACPPSSDQPSSSTSTQNVEPQNVEPFVSSVTPLRNGRMYDPKMNRLTAVKRLARNKRKSYPKYGPYPCQWCSRILRTSQSFAGHMRAHYRRIETASRKAAKQAQQQQPQHQQEPHQQQQQLRKHQHQHQTQQLPTTEQQEVRKLVNAQARAKVQLAKARARAEHLARLLAQMNEKAKAQAHARPKPRARARARAQAPEPEPEPKPAPVPEPAATPTSAAVASGSGKQPLRMNDFHLRLSNCRFGQIISPGDKNNSVSTENVSNSRDFLLYTSRRPIISNSPYDYVPHYHHNLQAPPGLVASSSRSRPFIDINHRPVFVKQEVLIPDEDVKPPPGFHNVLSTSSHGGRLIVKEEDDVVACGPLNSLDLKL